MAWVATFDFAASSFGWINDAAHSRSFGTYSPGAWASEWGDVSGFDERLYIIKETDDVTSTITDVEVFYTTVGTVGTSPVVGILVNDITVASGAFTSPNTFSQLATGLSQAVGASTTIRTSAVGGAAPLVEGGLDITITKIIVSGSGAQPFSEFDVTFDLTGGGVGAATHAIETNQSGIFLFVALEGDTTGDQKIIKITRPTSTVPTMVIAYNPASGTNGNIAKTGDPDRMVFHGNFGTDIGVIDHAIAAGTNTDISPTSIGAKLIQPLRVDIPSDVDHIIAINRDDQDAIETEDGGSNWSTLNAALGQTVDAMAAEFYGQYAPFLTTFGGNDGADENLEYSPNEFVSLREDTSAALKAVGSIVSVDFVPGGA